MTNIHNLKIGDTLLYVSNYQRSKPCLVPVRKIGRKWVSFGKSWDQYRANIKTLEADGGEYLSPGQFYLNYSAYADHEELRNLKQLILQAEWIIRDGDEELETIRHAARTLGVYSDKTRPKNEEKL